MEMCDWVKPFLAELADDVKAYREGTTEGIQQAALGKIMQQAQEAADRKHSYTIAIMGLGLDNDPDFKEMLIPHVRLMAEDDAYGEYGFIGGLLDLHEVFKTTKGQETVFTPEIIDACVQRSVDGCIRDLGGNGEMSWGSYIELAYNAFKDEPALCAAFTPKRMTAILEYDWTGFSVPNIVGLYETFKDNPVLEEIFGLSLISAAAERCARWGYDHHLILLHQTFIHKPGMHHAFSGGIIATAGKNIGSHRLAEGLKNLTETFGSSADPNIRRIVAEVVNTRGPTTTEPALA